MNKDNFHADEQLVQCAQQGEINAYNKLISRYKTKIYQIIYFNISDQANTNDLVQEVLLKVYRYLPYFKCNSLFSTWLYRIVHNTIKNHYRKVNLRLETELHYTNEQESTLINSPERLIMNYELSKKIETAIATLNDELRTCYDRHTFEGQSYKRIAKEMNCPIGTVRSRIYRARKLLIELIADSE